jgi:MarR family transcriptional regulator, organic hydroperoxide resistance regulator
MSTKPMEETISYLLAQVCKAHRAAANEVLAEEGLHVGQELVLHRLWHECGMTQSDLAKHLCVEAPTVTRMLQRMERAKLIERCVDTEDGRVSRVHVTEKGRALKGTIEQAWQTLEAKVLADFTVEERLLLRRMLIHVYDNLTTSSASA